MRLFHARTHKGGRGMAKKHHPRRGSHGYSPRKRAKREIPRFKNWPELDISESPRIQGFVGYKAGMTHIIGIDTRPKSTTSGHEIQLPVTVIEVPPLEPIALRVYERTPYGLRTLTEFWNSNLNKHLSRRINVPSKGHKIDVETEKVDDVRILVHTQPYLVTGVPKKKPEIVELRIGGGTIEQRLDFAREIMKKEIKITDFAHEGKIVDVIGVTKGKGFQGAVQRWGVKLLHHKDRKHRRKVGTMGPHFPAYVRPTVPLAGQMGYHRRTEYNKIILKIGDNGDEITPKGGFLRYGIVRNEYLLLKGSIPGTTKRLIGLRDPIRPPVAPMRAPEITYISVESPQGA